ncbi:MAG TPA: BON domain-containing protein [Azospirillaceae bacterium]|nr:BON domain-containing protein [Azospirillaceae bacterium]
MPDTRLDQVHDPAGARDESRPEGRPDKDTGSGGPGSGRDDIHGYLGRAIGEMPPQYALQESARRQLGAVRGPDFRGRGPQGYRRADARISEDVHEVLTDDPFVDATDIRIMVVSGEVTLDGTVDSRDAKRRAEDIVHDVLGVTHVQNNLRARKTGPQE